MSNLVRTTINLPKPLYQDVHLYAAAKNISVSQIIRNCLSRELGYKNGKDILKLAGILSLSGKKVPSRSQIYSQYVKKKLGR